MNGFMLGAGLSCVVSSGLNGVSERGLELAAVGLGGVEKSRIRFTGGGSLSVVIGGRGDCCCCCDEEIFWGDIVSTPVGCCCCCCCCEVDFLGCI